MLRPPQRLPWTCSHMLPEVIYSNCMSMSTSPTKRPCMHEGKWSCGHAHTAHYPAPKSPSNSSMRGTGGGGGGADGCGLGSTHDPSSLLTGKSDASIKSQADRIMCSSSRWRTDVQGIVNELPVFENPRRKYCILNWRWNVERKAQDVTHMNLSLIHI